MNEMPFSRVGSVLSRVSVLTATIVLTSIGLLLSSGFQVFDPMVRHDDFAALLADPTGYYPKTLYEGRWINYLWHLRGVATPSWLSYLAYQFFWSVFAACLANLALGDKGLLWHRVAMALLVALVPSALLISLWFNTLMPGMAMVALYAWLSTQVDERIARGLLVVFVPLTLMAYTTYPLFLLVLCLARADTLRSFRDLVGVMILFIASFALGLVVIFTLNYVEHGVFGVPMAPWRNATPAHDLASAIENAKQIGMFLYQSGRVLGFGFTPLTMAHLVLLAAGIAVVGRRDPWRVVYLLSGIAAGLGLVFLQTVKSGISLPVRVISFAWALHAVLFVLMVLQLSENGGIRERLTRNLLIFLVMAYAAGTFQQSLIYAAWQKETRAMAAEIGEGSGSVFVTGTYKSLLNADRAGIQNPRGLRLRLTYLTGRIVITCEEQPAECVALPPDMLEDLPPGETQVHHLADKVVVRLSKQVVSAR
ncbi:hypothetical protein DL239_15665 [Sedimentitalea sp. CY04]|uniref:Glucosyl transferase GtrII n=2 Tax=Parasedimentitalea denitrificans TaxID=2211118 RepID=A0ABX0W9S0_9RHOB|nr:hypothetical protein [Sedimentitalea sp. CY04]